MLTFYDLTLDDLKWKQFAVYLVLLLLRGEDEKRLSERGNTVLCHQGFWCERK